MGVLKRQFEQTHDSLPRKIWLTISQRVLTKFKDNGVTSR